MRKPLASEQMRSRTWENAQKKDLFLVPTIVEAQAVISGELKESIILFYGCQLVKSGTLAAITQFITK